MQKPLRQLATELAEGTTSARDLVEAAVTEIEAPAGEGSRAFVAVAVDRARSEADRYDRHRSDGETVPAFAGIPIAIKDLADIEGEVTTAGSVVLKDQSPAAGNAVAVQRLRDAGFVIIGRTNMTEFAFSGLGLNPHYQTPKSPWDRKTGRIPGGSSSGTAVAVADGMVSLGLGTDTGGSCRIPAAFCNIVGYKPTASKVPLDGIVPLSPSLDSVGPLGNTVDCVAIGHAVMAGETLPPTMTDPAPRGLKLGLITNYMLDDLDELVAKRFETIINSLSAAGVEISEITFDELDELADINHSGGLAPAEALAWHEDLISERGEGYDQRVRRRILGGARATAVDYVNVLKHRQRLVLRMHEIGNQFDALVCPTVAIVPPAIDSFPPDGDPADPDDAYYSSTNMKALRNTSAGNFVDSCAMSLPLCTPDQRPEAPAVGLMLMAPSGRDDQLLQTAAAIESVCSSQLTL